MNQVVHFEIPVDDMEAAKEFYSIFGWDLIDMPEMGYIGVRTTAVDENRMPKEPGAINGGMMKRTDDVKAPVIAIQVDSVDTFIKKVIANGGKLIMPKVEIPNMGYYAYIADPQGNVLGLWESMR
ncbi:glyoxalase/bleomycin resistance protein/dioxygenase [Simkania negevensis Z]|uniref:Glyoxalase/bleomycin resistance protein/dioxygenase n=2 Tax=Simkania negevensis TaxID=83561 RepID=F8L4F1_SIMNZ|nr:glyoxalase/bleomycin resistance protein/dioxygenase [Simkania negevensis Z]